MKSLYRKVTRKVLLAAGIEIPDGAISYHTEQSTIFFHVPEEGTQGSYSTVSAELTAEQRAALLAANRLGTFGWDI